MRPLATLELADALATKQRHMNLNAVPDDLENFRPRTGYLGANKPVLLAAYNQKVKQEEAFRGGLKAWQGVQPELCQSVVKLG